MNRIKVVRIGIYDPYLDDLGGGEKYMISLASHLSEENEVFVFWNNSADLAKTSNRFNLDVSKIKVVNSIFSGRNFLRKISQTKNYDSLIVLSDGSIPITFSDLYIHMQQPILGKIDKSFKNRTKIKRVKKFFCNSYFTKSFIDKSFGVNSEVIYPPVFINKIGIPKENVIINVGRYRRKGKDDFKKQEFQLLTFKEMVDEGLKDWKFVLVAGIREEDRNFFEKIKKLAKSYPIEIIENAGNDKLWREYSRSKIYWHASGFGEDLEKNPDFAEHFGISTVEAMGAGAVPVVINAGGQKEIVDDEIDGLLWSSKKDLKKQTLRLINDSKFLDKLAKRSELKAQKFSIEEFNKKIDNLLK